MNLDALAESLFVPPQEQLPQVSPETVIADIVTSTQHKWERGLYVTEDSGSSLIAKGNSSLGDNLNVEISLHLRRDTHQSIEFVMTEAKEHGKDLARFSLMPPSPASADLPVFQRINIDGDRKRTAPLKTFFGDAVVQMETCVLSPGEIRSLLSSVRELPEEESEYRNIVQYRRHAGEGRDVFRILRKKNTTNDFDNRLYFGSSWLREVRYVRKARKGIGHGPPEVDVVDGSWQDQTLTKLNQ